MSLCAKMAEAISLSYTGKPLESLDPDEKQKALVTAKHSLDVLVGNVNDRMVLAARKKLLWKVRTPDALATIEDLNDEALRSVIQSALEQAT